MIDTHVRSLNRLYTQLQHWLFSLAETYLYGRTYG